MLYNTYGNYNKQKYGEKVYKLPINLPITCPNRDGKVGVGGCTFCAEIGTGFESLSNETSVIEQINRNMEYIGKKYNATKFIAYFQNYTNTYMPIHQFKNYMLEAASTNIIGITVSTRPDSINEEHLVFLKSLENRGLEIVIELGLQSANDKTLIKINRGHTVDDFIKGVNLVQKYKFPIIAHLILNLPYDNLVDVIDAAKLFNRLKIHGVKLHSLYIPKESQMGRDYLDGKIEVGKVEDYIERVGQFLSHINKDVVIYRLVARAPKEDTLFCNYGISWWKIKDMIDNYMVDKNIYQGYNEN